MKKASLLLALSLLSILLCIILAPIVCMPLDSDEIMGTFEVSLFEPTITAFILAIISAIFASLFVITLAKKHNKSANPLILSIGIGLFGLFYGLRTAYSDAANILDSFYNTWGSNSWNMASLMPEWSDKFHSTASIYMILIVVSTIITAFGIYKVYISIRK